MTVSDKEWNQRILCSDGNCIGVVGPDGHCKLCGLPYDGELPIVAPDSETVDDGAEGTLAHDMDTMDEVTKEDQKAFVETVSDDEWERRTLCADESCIGVVGPDGRCKECGKSYPG